MSNPGDRTIHWNSYTGVEYILNTLQALKKEVTCPSEAIGRRIGISDLKKEGSMVNEFQTSFQIYQKQNGR